MDQRKAVQLSLAILAAVAIVGAVTFYLLNDEQLLTGTATPAVVTTTDTVIYDTCEDLRLPCPPPGPGSPAPSGSAEPNVDALAQACFGGDMQACDDLYTATANGSPPSPRPDLQAYFDYAYTCGDRLSVAEVNDRLCVNIYEST